jgi:hypothetical protein
MFRRRIKPEDFLDPDARWRRRRRWAPCFCDGYSEHLHRRGKRWWG